MTSYQSPYIADSKVSDQQTKASQMKEELIYQAADDTKQQDLMLQQFSTLDEQLISEQQQLGYSNKLSGRLDDSLQTQNQGIAKNFLLRFQKSTTLKLFQINYVLVENHMISRFLYHAIILIEWLQVFFYLFYKIVFINNFIADASKSNLQPSANQNVSASSNTTSSTEDALVVVLTQDEQKLIAKSITDTRLYRIDLKFRWVNFHLYTLESSQTSQFFSLYAAMIGLFFFLVALMLTLSGKLFSSSKKETIKDGTRFLIQSISLILTIYMTLFQIPFFHMLLQGFFCEEDLKLEYSLSSFACDNVAHNLLIYISSFTLFSYFIFLMVQNLLFNSNSFDSELPWSQFENKISHLKMIIRFILVVTFVFEKSGGHTHAIMHLITGFLTLYIVTKRLQVAIIFDRSIYYAQTFYEVFQMCLMFILPVHQLQGNKLTVMPTVVLFLSSSILSIAAPFLIAEVRKIILLKRQPYSNELQGTKNYIFQMYKLILSQAPEEQIELQGIFSNHIEMCHDRTCKCKETAETIDEFKQYQKIKLQHGIDSDIIFDLQRLEDANCDSKNKYQTFACDNNTPKITPQPSLYYTPHTTAKPSEVNPQFTSLRYLNNSSTLIIENPSIAMIGKTAKNILNDVSDQSLYLQQNSIENMQHQERARRFILDVEEQLGNMIEDSEDQSSNQNDIKYLERQYFKFYASYLAIAMNRFKDSIDLKLIHAFIQSNKLNNQFKAVFDLMLCQQNSPDLQQ